MQNAPAISISSTPRYLGIFAAVIVLLAIALIGAGAAMANRPTTAPTHLTSDEMWQRYISGQVVFIDPMKNPPASPDQPVPQDWGTQIGGVVFLGNAISISTTSYCGFYPYGSDEKKQGDYFFHGCSSWRQLIEKADGKRPEWPKEIQDAYDIFRDAIMNGKMPPMGPA